mmetsp:Transcript_385/g.997  ORF Transcript_385/g.997 Transcript_385/m.997 type:complete len:85 (-) Transcript_385:204-458(-)
MPACPRLNIMKMRTRNPAFDIADTVTATATSYVALVVLRSAESVVAPCLTSSSSDAVQTDVAEVGQERTCSAVVPRATRARVSS